MVSVSNFAKKTGDYKSLSAVDIKVLALAYQLEKEHVGTDHIKTTPDRQVMFKAIIKYMDFQFLNLATFFVINTNILPCLSVCLFVCP